MKFTILADRECEWFLSPNPTLQEMTEDKEEVDDIKPNKITVGVVPMESIVDVKPNILTICGYQLVGCSVKPWHDFHRHGLLYVLLWNVYPQFLSIPFYSVFGELLARVTPYLVLDYCPTLPEMITNVTEKRNQKFHTEFLTQECVTQAELMQGMLAMLLKTRDSELIQLLEYEIDSVVENVPRSGYGRLPAMRIEVTNKQRELAEKMWLKTLGLASECPRILR